MTHDGIVKGVLVGQALALAVCVYVLGVAIEKRMPWWMVAGLVLAVANGFVHTYTTYRQLRGKQSGDTPLQKRVMSLLTWGTLLLVFVPLFAPRVWAYLRQ